MRKLKALVLSAVMGLSVSCTPLMAAPYFTSKKICDAVRFFERTIEMKWDSLVMLNLLDPEECAIIVADMLYKFDCINHSSRLANNGMHLFSYEWLIAADREEINREMVYLLEDTDNFDTRYFGFDKKLCKEARRLVVAMLTSIRNVYFEYYVERIKRATEITKRQMEEKVSRSFAPAFPTVEEDYNPYI